MDCDCSRRSATRARRRVMGTRCSGGRPGWGRGRGHLGQHRRWEHACGDARQRQRRHALAPIATASQSSPLVTRPSLPVPATEPADRLLSPAAWRRRAWPRPRRRPRQVLPRRLGRQRAQPVARGLPAATAPTLAFGVDLGDDLVRPPRCRHHHHDFSQHAGRRRRTSSTTLSVSISIRISSAATAHRAFFLPGQQRWLRPRIQTTGGL